MSEVNQKKMVPIVSVFCPTYNHELYIRKCLDGFVMQKTSFPYEIIIHDDASTDSTVEIIKEYEKIYPDKIRSILQSENQLSKDNLHLVKTMLQNVKGKYIALCEGDDYWIDPLKLEKQVAFLEANPDYSICFHKVKVLNNSELVDDFVVWGDVKEDSTIRDLMEFNYIHTPTVMYRNTTSINTSTFKSVRGVVLADTLLNLLYANTGKIKRLDEVMAIYRYGNGMWSGESDIEKKELISINTLRNSAYLLNENAPLLDKWYFTIMSKKNKIKENFDNITDLEGFLINMYAVDQLKSNVPAKVLIKAIFNKLIRN